MGKLFHLLTNLVLDPKKQSVFINNPRAFMDEVGLSKAEQTAIMSKEGAKVAAFFADERIQTALTTSDPGPDPLPDPDPFPLPDPDPSPSESTRRSLS